MDRPSRAAVALGNASLLGAGHLLLGRRRLAIGTAAVTVVLLALTAAVAAVWCEVLVLAWWAATVAHGWFLARGSAHGPAVRRPLLVALAVTIPVVLVAGFLRFDTARTEGRVAAARAAGDCPGVRAAQDRVWFGDRVAGASLAARGDATVRTCRRLAAAKARLVTALDGHTSALRPGFATLAAALREPGNDEIVGAALDGFLGGLPAEDPCDTAAVTDWLRQRRPSHDVLDRSAAAVRRTAPTALVGCADDLMDSEDWTRARARYRQLLAQYPDDDLADKAEDGAELANVSDLLETNVGQPPYCAHPAKYRGARPYGKGTNTAMFFGNDDYTDRLPDSWTTGDAAGATLVVCAGDDEDGDTVRTCTYRGTTSGHLSSVTFHKIAIPVKAYELRTGKRVADRKVQISGSSCPPVISSTSYTGIGGGYLDPDRYVDESTSDVRDAFRSLVIR